MQKGYDFYLFVLTVFVISFLVAIQAETQSSYQKISLYDSLDESHHATNTSYKRTAKKRPNTISFTVSEEFRKKHIRSGDCFKVYSLEKKEAENFKDNLKSTAIFWPDFTKASYRSKEFSRKTNTFIMAPRTDTFDIAGRIEYIVRQIWATCERKRTNGALVEKDCHIDMMDYGYNDNLVTVIEDIEWNTTDSGAIFKSCKCGTAKFTVTVREQIEQTYSIFHFSGQEWYLPEPKGMVKNLKRTEQWNDKRINKNKKNRHAMIKELSNNYKDLKNENPKTCC